VLNKPARTFQHAQNIMLKKAKSDKIGKDIIIQKAYDIMIKNYEDTIMFLEANHT